MKQNFKTSVTSVNSSSVEKFSVTHLISLDIRKSPWPYREKNSLTCSLKEEMKNSKEQICDGAQP